VVSGQFIRSLTTDFWIGSNFPGFFMSDEIKQITQIDMQPEEIIRSVKMRFRICNYLFNTGACWMAASGVLGILIILEGHHAEPDALSLLLTLIMIGTAIYTLAFALTLAIYRCPVCDKYLSRFRPDKLHCSNCSAKVK